ncbi:DUF3109 family protein [Aneurinibacillus tyrosinisolvens]|uniref:DUF3109 family protein n=1 Tax=Aneurinibacillus tyrosinisolvens TaxID=1443435 RepID=UPI00063F7833|nr:DUF3109 family protein [Aneurinibacillus tyrosinisolvens]
MRSRYYGTPEQLGFTEALSVYHYITRHLGKTIHRYDRFLIDEALMTPANLDCFNCHLVHGRNCCEKGQPYSMDGENLELFEEHAFAILERHTHDERVRLAKEKGVFEQTRDTNYYASIRTHNGNCLYLVEENGKRICSIHRYALDNGIDPAKLKPFSCSLFPLEIIECDEGILVTAITEETESFSRWGDFYRSTYSCVNPLRRPPNTPAEFFNEAGYVPAWEWGRDLLAAYWGKETIQEFEKLLPLVK